jgi:hypothetical protein
MWVFAERFTAFHQEHVTRLRKNAMRDDIRVLKTVRYVAIAAGVLLTAGIVILMVLARGKTGTTETSQALSRQPCSSRACAALSQAWRLCVRSARSGAWCARKPSSGGREAAIEAQALARGDDFPVP